MTSGHNDDFRRPVAGGRPQPEALPILFARQDIDVRAHRRLRSMGIANQGFHKRVAAHVAVGFGATIWGAWQRVQPIGRQKAERTPCRRPPPFANAPAFQNDMRDPTFSKAMAQGDARLASADDDNVSLFHIVSINFGGRRFRHPSEPPFRVDHWMVLTPTETETPFVSMSKTADRARVCSTNCWSFSDGASPSISNATVMF